ncbi:MULTISPECIES: serpin family protein [unclassified Crossiella]|uniref:serpin family protein n=1 Tax=unclassified Crossiella TaxID=2620835 RepID=UPI001FFE7071|nr:MULTISPECIES: serpin family protein [unclassified Crossiella]MCK2239442.1 serpin family protein [Crossiella sp. S99.2]MCK2252137.1 serpin family protein [Crossiella sp. S99.1]
MHEFTLALHRALSGPADTNACWSPYSVATALGLVAEAAKGRSRAEIVELIGEPAELLKRVAGAAELWAGTVAVTSTLWVDDGVPVHEEFLARLDEWPGARVRELGLRAAPEVARGVINADVAETTRGLITEAVPAGAITPDTLVALVNALYLKVGWLTPFRDADRTAALPFHAPGGTVPVPTMSRGGKLRHRALGGWQSVVLPADGGTEAVVLLPDGDLDTATLDTELLDTLVGSGVYREVELFLPRFTVASRLELADPVGELGVRTVFGEHADLGGLTRERVAVTAALHQAVLDVDEQGLEGAAVTAMMFGAVSLELDPELPLEVRVDRPFLFLVRHQESGAPYFLARVARP